MGDMRKAYKVLVGKPMGRNAYRIPRRRGEKLR
jgi:hypothetical protein